MGNEAKPTGGKINERGNKYNTDEGRCNIGTEGLQYKTLKINPPPFLNRLIFPLCATSSLCGNTEIW